MTESEEYDLAMHLVGRHKNIAAVHNTPEDNDEAHKWDHVAPGGIRNHEFSDRSYDPLVVEQVLEEYENPLKEG